LPLLDEPGETIGRIDQHACRCNRDIDALIESKIRQTDIAGKGAGVGIAAVERRAARIARAACATGCPAVAAVGRGADVPPVFAPPGPPRNPKIRLTRSTKARNLESAVERA
jgi:hypothetical protein